VDVIVVEGVLPVQAAASKIAKIMIMDIMGESMIFSFN